MSGRLMIVSTPIGNLGDFSQRAGKTLQSADIIACEDTRMTRKLLALSGLSTAAKLVPYHDHNGAMMRPRLLADIGDGKVVALVSDAGTPLISDPGYKLVAACHEHGFTVSAIPGPSAPLAALAVSGLPSDRFLFAGFLPSTEKACMSAIRGVSTMPMTIIWFESARRLLKTLNIMSDILGPRLAVVARELTKLHEEIVRAPLPELVALFGQRDTIKGEIVILVEGWRQEDAVFEEDDLKVMLRTELEHHSLRDAVDVVVATTGLPRRTIYKLALQLSGSQKPD
jgi:16S rRNA (cytidine1402-2'-O)-methyltransferase